MKACSVLQAESIIDEMMSEELPVNLPVSGKVSRFVGHLVINITFFSVLQLVCLLCSYVVAFCFFLKIIEINLQNFIDNTMYLSAVTSSFLLTFGTTEHIHAEQWCFQTLPFSS